ncbi:hyaluronan synthase [Pectinatus cerevisiiphilus]|uniref:Hyaluronan synthase n=2 Tax=Pectinatus cerevisiiphilus TaxID=86956 RepID=A0A4R3K299_9FIRM|nr:hyaluronan synthase [Pectinatus cerevisiiphilus]
MDDKKNQSAQPPVNAKTAAEILKQSMANKEDVLLHTVNDRRMLPNVPDKDKKRTTIDRRGIDDHKHTESYSVSIQKEKTGRRYVVDYAVKIEIRDKDKNKKVITGRAVNLSSSGISCSIPNEYQESIENSAQVKLTFQIKPGSMPEGYETKIKRLAAKWVRTYRDKDNKLCCAFQFDQLLAQYIYKNRQCYMLSISAFFMFFICLFIVLLRSSSIMYFSVNKVLYLYSIIAATFLLSRYLFGALYRPTPINPDFTPAVTIIIPCFNEEQWIKRTILSCVNQDYPVDKLEVIVIDDCSNDNSVEKIKEIIADLSKERGYAIAERVRYHVQPTNAGKREALAAGAAMAKNELLVFVDSDSFLDPFAIRNIVQPFQDEKMGGVSGRTDVVNTYTNALTKMQSVRYYIAFRILKAAEGLFDAVTCLSGPLSCYRKDLVLKYSDAWLKQKFLGQKATFGDDRAMTNFILRSHRTDYQDSAVCSTIVPNTYKIFLKQQMRWKRSWLRESLITATYMWKKEPFMALSFYMGLLVPMLAPIIVIYNLIYIPFTHHVFPLTFLIGILMMALLMSVAQLFLRRSTTWVYGIWFCLYYEVVLLWQMPIAWVTFWKSTWGTRMTAADLKAYNKKNKKEGMADGGK